MMKIGMVLGLSLLLSACQTAIPVSPTPPLTPPPAPSSTTFITRTPIFSSTNTPEPTATPTETVFQVCSPLEDETISSLPTILVNPLVIPDQPGTDFGHPGLDFAYYQRGDRPSIQGIEVYAILSATVVTSLEDSFPYGNAVLLETPLEALPPDLMTALIDAYLPIPENLIYQYNCPNVSPPELTGSYSLYHLYAHLEQPPPHQAGDQVHCGARLGTVGSTGYSSNPHLHLETRLGPSGANFPSMTHYLTTASAEELSNYCLWRSSGYYQVIDPFLILQP